MCGIAGIIDNNIQGLEAQAVMKTMLASISHRGPDGSGIWNKENVTLGHNRLSIIDLSDQANQPMHGWGSTIIFNGEIYNYLELRKDLISSGYKFNTHSDTEVILALYDQMGDKCVEKMVGMWAFSIWDDTKNLLFCSRDRFGIKPFYFYHRQDRLIWGSELKIFEKIPFLSLSPNHSQCIRGLQLGWTSYQDETYFSEINQLKPGENFIWKNGKISCHSYWNLDTNNSNPISEKDAIESYRNLFDTSISQHLRSDVTVGACLSGGLDSSSILASICTQYPNQPIKSFTVYYSGKEDVDERPYAGLLQQKFSNIKSLYIEPNETMISDNFEAFLKIQDVPVGGSSPYSQYFVMKFAAENGIKVILDGQGADEMLAGYMHSFYRVIGNQLISTNPIKGLSTWIQQTNHQGFNKTESASLLAKSMLCGLYGENTITNFELKKGGNVLPKYIKNLIALKKLNTGSRLNQFLFHNLFELSLSNLLHFEDRNSMAHSIESRVPFLDHRLVEFAFSLGDNLKIKNAVTKYIHREALKDILPPQIANRKDKKGFVTPGEVKWLRGPLSFLLNQPFVDLPYLDKNVVSRTIQEYKQGNNKNARWIWRYCILQKWLSEHSFV